MMVLIRSGRFARSFLLGVPPFNLCARGAAAMLSRNRSADRRFARETGVARLIADLALATAFAWGAGIRLYATLLILGMAARLGWTGGIDR